MNTAFTLRLAALAAVLYSALPVSPARASEPLATLGTNNLTVLENEVTFSQSATTLTINPGGVGQFLFGQFADSYNWTGVSSLGLFLSAPNGSPNASFKVEFYDSTLTYLLNEYTGFASGLLTTPTFLPLTLVPGSGTGDFSDVGYFWFNWNDSVTGGALMLHSVGGTLAPVVWSSAGGSAWLTATNWTGSAVPGSGEVAQFGANPTSGVTPVGIDMGSNGGAQSVGAIEVTAARSASLLINNSAASASGTLTLNGVTVNGTQNVILRNNSAQLLTLTNGATANMSIALGNATANVVMTDGSGGITIGSSISGSGRSLTKSGGGAGVLTLSGSNTFSGATTVSSGTLRLDSSTGGALGSTASVAVASGATLLVSRSNQVNDSASISLSGGTITRGAGVSETFGNLSVSGSGFLDFGTGAAGELKFGTYTPSALLTIYNFLPGNRLVFVGSDLSGSIDDSGLFGFQGAFSSAWNSGTSTFTVTAIPEASTWFAAMLLVALCAGGLWHTAYGMWARGAQ
ncbi:MAG: autotransporter-associated beta strand repeat-containing protein [Spartobacteria bacterium]